jgi:hypothetical protein
LIKGAVRDIMQIGAGRKTLLVFAKNNDKPAFLIKQNPGIHTKL